MPRPKTELEALTPGQITRAEGSAVDTVRQLGDGESNNARSNRSAAGLTINELARHWRVSNHTIRAWIKTGELRAVNLALTGLHRPRYLIRWADIESFELLRMNQPLVPASRPSSNRQPVRTDGRPDRY